MISGLIFFRKFSFIFEKIKILSRLLIEIALKISGGILFINLYLIIEKFINLKNGTKNMILFILILKVCFVRFFSIELIY